MAYRPWVGRKFGIEMEMNEVSVEHTNISESTLRSTIQRGLTSVGLPTTRCSTRDAGYYHSNGQTWDVKTDASCGYSNRCGWEVASPAMMLDEEGECAELKAVCGALRELKPRIDRKCGLHVHVEVRDFDWHDLHAFLKLWARYEPFVFEMCPPSRRTNQYCPPVRKAEWAGNDAPSWTRIEAALNTATNQQALQSAPFQRGAINLAHFWMSKRIEFRLGAGTVEYEKIVRWVQFLLSFVARVKRADMPMIQTGQWSNKGFSTMYVFKMLGLAPSRYVPPTEVADASTKLLAWVEARRAKFRRDNPNADAIDTAVARGAYADAGRR